MLPQTLGLLLPLVLARTTRAAGLATCYMLNGEVDAEMRPCDPSAEVSTCCRPTDLCLSNGLCLGGGGNNGYSQQGCTSSSWDSPCHIYCSKSISMRTRQRIFRHTLINGCLQLASRTVFNTFNNAAASIQRGLIRSVAAATSSAATTIPTSSRVSRNSQPCLVRVSRLQPQRARCPPPPSQSQSHQQRRPTAPTTPRSWPLEQVLAHLSAPLSSAS